MSRVEKLQELIFVNQRKVKKLHFMIWFSKEVLRVTTNNFSLCLSASLSAFSVLSFAVYQKNISKNSIECKCTRLTMFYSRVTSKNKTSLKRIENFLENTSSPRYKNVSKHTTKEISWK